MVEENSIDAVAEVVESPVPSERPATAKQRAPRRKKIAEGSSKAAPAKRRKHGAANAGESELAAATGILKGAVKRGRPRTAKSIKPQATTAMDEMADLIQLEEENKRLRKNLANKLREENADLRKRLGLD